MLVDPAVNLSFEVFHEPRSDQFDYARKVTRPFQILSGGYQIIFKNGKWSEVYGGLERKTAVSIGASSASSVWVDATRARRAGARS